MKNILFRFWATIIVLAPVLCLGQVSKPFPPAVVYRLVGNTDGGLVQRPDGKFMLFKVNDGKLISMTSSDGSNWGDAKVEIEKEINSKTYYNGIMLVDKDGELHRIFQKFRAVPQYANRPKPKYPFQYSDTLYDIWHCMPITDL